MGEWVPITDKFIEADVIRWREGVFSRPRRRRARVMKIGERRITGEVLKNPDADGWVVLMVRYCEVLSETAIGQIVERFKDGKTLRRSRETILHGEPERLLWSDETARDVVARGFIPETAPSPRRRRADNRGAKRMRPSGSRRRPRR